MSTLVVCSDCHRWTSTAGVPICGICRVSRAVRTLPGDSRLTTANYDLILSILERGLGEVNSWLSIPLEEPSSQTSLDHPAEVRERNPPQTEEDSSSSGRKVKSKRSSRDIGRREERKEAKRQPPTPPSPPRRSHSPRNREGVLTAASKSKSRPEVSQDFVWGKSHKKNKGKKHRERGIAYRERWKETAGPEDRT